MIYRKLSRYGICGRQIELLTRMLAGVTGKIEIIWQFLYKNNIYCLLIASFLVRNFLTS